MTHCDKHKKPPQKTPRSTRDAFVWTGRTLSNPLGGFWVKRLADREREKQAED